MERKTKRAGCALKGNPLPFVTAIVASNAGDFGQGRVWCSNTGASRSSLNHDGTTSRRFHAHSAMCIELSHDDCACQASKLAEEN